MFETTTVVFFKLFKAVKPTIIISNYHRRQFDSYDEQIRSGNRNFCETSSKPQMSTEFPFYRVQ